MSEGSTDGAIDGGHGSTPGRGAPVAGVIWDFDGTLADTRRRNLRVTRRIFREVLGREPDRHPELGSVERYEAANRRAENWRELYRETFGLDEEETDRAGRAWSEYQLSDETPTPLFPGVVEAVRSLDGMPQGIVSLNSRENILGILQTAEVARHFGVVVGYREVDLRRQKPHPEALLLCLERLEVATGRVLYVGDHDTDVRCARNANARLRGDGRELQVVAAGARFPASPEVDSWAEAPDHVAGSPGDVVRIARGEWNED
jgi:HAD superfamily hydrolase (TIGR01549 family)